MKKLLSVFLILILSSFIPSLSFADKVLKSNISSSVASNAPRWEEFCPPKYLNAQHIDAKLPSTFASIIMGATIVLAPLCYYLCDKYIAASKNNYWVDRRENFNNQITACYANKNNLQDCFNRVREVEYYANALNQSSEQDMQTAKNQIYAQAVNSALNQFQTMQINNNINNVNAIQNAVNSSSTGYVNSNNLKKQSCQNKCENERMMCRRGVQSAPTFGNDISTSQNSHLAKCELNYSRCVKQCSY